MSEQLLSLSNVSFSYSDKVMLIKSLSLEIAKGERVFVMGASGSGKTTLLNLIGGVLLPNSGDIRVLGKSLSSMKSSERDSFRADSIGIIFQQFNLIPYLSVIENVMLPLQFSVKRRKKIQGSPEREARNLLNKLGLDDSTVVGGPCSSLSVGQRQRVAAARALLGNPEIIIADEPTSALDPKRSNEFLDILFKQCDESDSTLIFVSHEETLQDKFSRVISLEDLS